MRRGLYLRSCSNACFNSRTLGRVRRRPSGSSRVPSFGFNSRTLGRVRRYSPPYPAGPLSSFNSRTLGRVRHSLVKCSVTMTHVSIHAPWEGCDASNAGKLSFTTTFQFTHPGKGATTALTHSVCSPTSFNSRTLGRVRRKGESQESEESEVSIHAPWEGCDGTNALVRHRSPVSIHAPWEGCDGRCTARSTTASSFNSRTLGRVRLTSGARPRS